MYSLQCWRCFFRKILLFLEKKSTYTIIFGVSGVIFLDGVLWWIEIVLTRRAFLSITLDLLGNNKQHLTVPCTLPSRSFRSLSDRSRWPWCNRSASLSEHHWGSYSVVGSWFSTDFCIPSGDLIVSWHLSAARQLFTPYGGKPQK